MQPTVIHLHGPLGERFGHTHRRIVSSPGEAVRSLCYQKKGFREMVSAPGASYALLVGDYTPGRGGCELGPQDVHMLSGNQDIHLVPVVEGNKDEFGQIIVGIALIVASFYTGGAAGAGWATSMGMSATAAGYVGSAMFAVGTSMVIGGIAQMISPGPMSSTRTAGDDRTNSLLFNGPINTVGQNQPVQLVYGEVDTGSMVIATMLTTSDEPLTGGSSEEGGVDATAMLTLASGSTKIANACASDQLRVWCDGIGTPDAAYPYNYTNRNVGPVHLISTATNSLKLSRYEYVMLKNAAGVITATSITEVKVGDTLATGEVVTGNVNTDTNTLTDLVNFMVEAKVQWDTLPEDLPNIHEFSYYLANGIPISVGLHYRERPNENPGF